MENPNPRPTQVEREKVDPREDAIQRADETKAKAHGKSVELVKTQYAEKEAR